MKTKCFDTFAFDELDERAKERARDWYRSVDTEIAWADENRESMEAFANFFPIKVKNWSYGDRSSGVTFEFTDDNLENLAGVRLYKWLVNGSADKLIKGDCPFTGYCMDETLLDPIRTFLKQPDKNTTFRDLLADCFHAWVRDCEAEIEHAGSAEYIDDMLVANEYEFAIDGECV